MSSREQGFTRWYDEQPLLSQAVRMMSAIAPQYQVMIAEAIIHHQPGHSLAYDSEKGLKRMGSQKITALMKSQVKRRWYDQDPKVHQAFNHLFLMDQGRRHEMALKIIITIEALQESIAQGNNPQEQHSLVKSIFIRDLPTLTGLPRFSVRHRAYTQPQDMPGLSTHGSSIRLSQRGSGKIIVKIP